MDWSLVFLLVLISLSALSLVGAVYLSGTLLGEFFHRRWQNQRRKKFLCLLARLMDNNPTQKDIIDLYRDIVKIAQTHQDFIPKLELALIDFKTSLLLNDSEIFDEKINSDKNEKWRQQINQFIKEIKNDHPFAGLEPPMISFFEESIRFIENDEKEASKSKIIELSKIFVTQFNKIEEMKQKNNWSYLATLAGVIIGLCSIVFAFLK